MRTKPFFLLLIAILLSILIASIVLVTRYFFSHDLSQSQRPELYGLVIDAGSTGTRIHGFKFDRNGDQLVLLNDYFHQEKPGLSSLSPDEAAQQVSSLINKAESFVPVEFQDVTTIRLKATAGFRLLDADKSLPIFEAVRSVLNSSKFQATNNSAGIIDGNEEGIASWFSINYLRDRLNLMDKIAALDLGGASTQVAFEVIDEIPKELQSSTVDVLNFNGKIKLFVNSYLNLGLMAVRKAIITAGVDDGQETVQSDCLHADTQQFQWQYREINYKVSSNGNSTFNDCIGSIKDVVTSLLHPKIPSLQNQTINAFSYFYDQAVKAQLVQNDGEGGEIEVGNFKQKAVEFCEERMGDDPWLCLDLTYIYVLLQDGYGLSDDKKVRLFNKINGHEASWALGSFLMEYITSLKNQ